MPEHLRDTASTLSPARGRGRGRGRGGRGGVNPYENPETWIAVNATLDETTGDVLLDLSPLNGTAPAAVRYAWHDLGDSCCDGMNPETIGVSVQCPPASCPISMAEAVLPGNPFIAKIVGEKCECISPQTCDE